MTTGVEKIRSRYVGNDSATEWGFTFSTTADSDVAVYLKLDGETQRKLDASEYTLVRGESGGTVTYPKSGSPLTSGDTIAVIRETPYKNAFDFKNQSDFSPSDIEDSDDDKTRQIQQVAEKLERAVIVEATDDTDPQQLITDLQQSAIDASTAASAAATSEANAATSEANAATSEANASASATSAATSAANAATSESNASDSADAAALSAAEADVDKMVWRGIWDVATAYDLHDVVYYGGSSYIATVGNTGSQPDISADWDIVASVGGVSEAPVPLSQVFTATEGQTNFTLANTPSMAWVWIEGAAQAFDAFTISGNDVVVSARTAGEEVKIGYVTSFSGVMSNNLADLSDVDLTGKAEGKVLGFNASGVAVPLDASSSVKATPTQVKNEDATDGSGNDLFVTPEDMIQHHGVAKAWGSFNGSGTVALQDGFNVSSITDVSAGRYRPNMSVTFANNDFAVSAICNNVNSQGGTTALDFSNPKTTSSFTFYALQANDGSAQDSTVIDFTVHGELA